MNRRNRLLLLTLLTAAAFLLSMATAAWADVVPPAATRDAARLYAAISAGFLVAAAVWLAMLGRRRSVEWIAQEEGE